MFLSGIDMGGNIVCTLLLPGKHNWALIKLQYAKYTAQLKFSTDLNMIPVLNEHKTFYLMLSTCMGILKLTGFFCVRQTKDNLVRRQ